MSQSLEYSKVFDVSKIVAVVTGGGTGIGLMISKALAFNGAKVYIIGRRKEILENAVKAHSKGPGKLIALPGDAADKADLDRMAAEVAKAEPSGIHLLVNNAGIARDQATHLGYNPQPDTEDLKAIKDHYWKSDPSKWAETFAVNVTAPYFASLAFLESLGKAREAGALPSIVNIASISGAMKGNSFGQPAYAASKAALLQLTRQLATVLVKTKIRVNCIAPAIFPSQMTSKAFDETTNESVMERPPSNPSGRFGTEADMAACILFLAGPGGHFFNAQVLYPDGGVLLTQPAMV